MIILLPVAQAGQPIQFSTPATARGDLSLQSEGGFAASSMALGQSFYVEGNSIEAFEGTLVHTRGSDGVIEFSNSVQEPTWVEIGAAGPGSANLYATDSWGIRITGGTHLWTAGHIHVVGTAPSGSIPNSLPKDHTPFPLVRYGPATNEPSVAMAGNAKMLTVAGSFSMEIFGIQGTLVRRDSVSVQSGSIDRVETPISEPIWVLKYARLDIRDGALSFDSPHPFRAAASSSNTTISLDGSLHLPLAEGAMSEGTTFANGTWHLQGAIQMKDLRPAPNGTVMASMDANGATLLVDGQPTRFQAAAPAIATTAGLLALLIAAVKAAPTLSALLTRLPPDKALENENRRKLYAYITANPGATFREVLRGTDMAAGTARHHLTVLARSKMIVEHGHRSTLRFFENHGKFDATWTSVVLLREDDLSKIYQWLTTHPNAFQRELLEHAESAWRWSRSTTQHRLARLIDGGLVEVSQAGRRKFYHAVAPEAAEPRPAKASWT